LRLYQKLLNAKEKRMRIFLVFLMGITLISGCSKQPLTLDESTSMKTLLKASDEQITKLVIDEATTRMDISAESISIEYILRDRGSQAMVVKLNIKR
jgi:uncharacterized lipoprotein YajG